MYKTNSIKCRREALKVESFLKDFLESTHTDFIGVNALGILRKDLVSVLGLERAKGFLLRYSHNCGKNDAKYFEEHFSWESDLEIIEAGYKINDLKGHAKLIPISVRADRKKGEFYYEGQYYFSYEADQHIQDFGFHTEAVCYTLTGYASGYASQYLGEEVFFKEIECIGKGDPNCTIIGKTLDEWGDEINDFLPFYKEENLSDELDRAYKRMEKQKKVLSDVMDINENLSKILIEGGDIATVLKVLSQNLSSTVILEDRNFNLIEACGDYVPYHFIELVEALNTKKKPVWMNRLFNEKRTIQLTVSEQFNGWKHERIISPVMLNNEVWGYISFIKKEGSFDEREKVLLERANTICALHFSNERTVIENEKRISGGFLNELLMPKPDIKNLSYRMKLMGYDLNKPHYVFILNIDHEGVENLNLIGFYNEMIDHIHYYLQLFKNNILVSALVDKIIIVVPDELLIEMKTDKKSFGEQLVKLISNKVMAKVSLGIGASFKRVDHFQKSYNEANKSLQIAKREGNSSNVIAFDELGYLGFLLNSSNVTDLEGFAVTLLKDIMKYDKESNGELLKTLYYLLEFQGNVIQTSRKMLVSEGAVRYRLKRISEISNINLTNSNDFVNAHLAVQILILFGLWEVTN